jgi:TfoX/Sxy family transcriptional regulator of competence genes
MKQWCAMMEAELLTWPDVEARPMFGMLGFYRKGKIFAAIPRNRTVGNTDAVLVKLQGASEKLANEALHHPKAITSAMPKAGWISMAMDSIDDGREMLGWFSQAYELAAKTQMAKKKKKTRHC